MLSLSASLMVMVCPSGAGTSTRTCVLLPMRRYSPASVMCTVVFALAFEMSMVSPGLGYQSCQDAPTFRSSSVSWAAIANARDALLSALDAPSTVEPVEPGSSAAAAGEGKNWQPIHKAAAVRKATSVVVIILAADVLEHVIAPAFAVI